jgi:hypothetical protein
MTTYLNDNICFMVRCQRLPAPEAAPVEGQTHYGLLSPVSKRQVVNNVCCKTTVSLIHFISPESFKFSVLNLKMEYIHRYLSEVTSSKGQSHRNTCRLRPLYLEWRTIRGELFPIYNAKTFDRSSLCSRIGFMLNQRRPIVLQYMLTATQASNAPSSSIASNLHVQPFVRVISAHRAITTSAQPLVATRAHRQSTRGPHLAISGCLGPGPYPLCNVNHQYTILTRAVPVPFSLLGHVHHQILPADYFTGTPRKPGEGLDIPRVRIQWGVRCGRGMLLSSKG